jgi:hypothetical protein
MNYATQHISGNLLKWQRNGAAKKRRGFKASGTLRAQALLRKMGEVKK